MNEPVIIVSGLPRSGTSMMMKMLAAGGIQIYTDHLREPDADNPEGYYEVEKMKNLANDSTWLYHMQGKAIKVISFLLYHLPISLRYKILFMQRDMQEILLSQKKMLDRSAPQAHIIDDELLAQKFETHLNKITEWIATQKHIDCLYVNYNTILGDPKPIVQEIQQFLQQPVDIEAMISAINPSLHRNRLK